MLRLASRPKREELETSVMNRTPTRPQFKCLSRWPEQYGNGKSGLIINRPPLFCVFLSLLF